MAWTIKYTDTARKQLKKLDKKTAKRIIDFMDERVSLQDNPRVSGKALKGKIFGSYWRYRLGDWRIICMIEDHSVCILVIEVGNRSSIYS